MTSVILLTAFDSYQRWCLGGSPSRWLSQPKNLSFSELESFYQTSIGVLFAKLFNLTTVSDPRKGSLSKNLEIKWDASYRWPSTLYCPIWNLGQMTIGKTHPTLFARFFWTYQSCIMLRTDLCSCQPDKNTEICLNPFHYDTGNDFFDDTFISSWGTSSHHHVIIVGKEF